MVELRRLEMEKMRYSINEEYVKIMERFIKLHFNE